MEDVHGRTTQRRVLTSDQKPSPGCLRVVGDRGGVAFGLSKGLRMCLVTESFGKARIAHTFESGMDQ
jgi:hypothetical protein